MEPLSIALLTLAALLVGALLPLIFQARATLRSAQMVLDASGPKLAVSLAEIAATTKEFNTIAKDAATTLGQVRGTINALTAVGSVVGPAAMAAVHAFRASRAEDAADRAEEARIERSASS